jgi:IS605 OrfB family transposase
MLLTSSYAIEIKNANKIFRNTIRIYKDAVSFCINAFESEWSDLENTPVTGKQRFAYADGLIHTTGTNQAKYPEFDRQFHKLPSYLRFDVINTALGYLSSYHSHLDKVDYDYECTEGIPTFQSHLNKLPTFYKGNVYKNEDTADTVKLKLFINNDWNWVSVKLKHTDIKSIQKHSQNAKRSCPTLERKNKKWFLRFAFDENVTLNNTTIINQKILSVDLGINTDATCSVMTLDGAILARESINFASDKDHLYHTLNKIKNVQQKYGSGNNIQKLWRHAKFHSDELAKKVACAITETAIKYGCDIIVFEHLEMKGKIKGSKKQRLAMWRKNAIQNVVTHKAHKAGIRISHVNAWNTSRLAFDGSGIVKRGKYANLPTYELCRFSNGKIYNCDLSASYNIGARYFIREAQKILSARTWSDIVAKVPECQKRTQCTYATLLAINAAV